MCENKDKNSFEMTSEKCHFFLDNTPKAMYFVAVLGAALFLFSKNLGYILDAVILVIMGLCFSKFKSPLIAIGFALLMLLDVLATGYNLFFQTNAFGGKNILLAFIFFAYAVNSSRAAYFYQKENYLRTNYINFFIKTAVGIVYSIAAFVVFGAFYYYILPYKMQNDPNLVGMIVCLFFIIAFVLAYFGFFPFGQKFKVTHKLPRIETDENTEIRNEETKEYNN